MGKMPAGLKEVIARNIRSCRMRKFPGRGGGKKCAEAFGVSPQQWSPWETGKRTPDELRLGQIAEFFGVSVEYLRCDYDGESRTSKVEQPGSPASFYWLVRHFVDYLMREGLVVRLGGRDTGGIVEKDEKRG